MNRLYIFIFFVFSIVFFPSFGALDKGNTHWLLLSVIPLFFLKTSFNLSFFKSKIFIVYALFISQVLISLFYTNNFNISVVDLSRQISERRDIERAEERSDTRDRDQQPKPVRARGQNIFGKAWQEHEIS